MKEKLESPAEILRVFIDECFSPEEDSWYWNFREDTTISDVFPNLNKAIKGFIEQPNAPTQTIPIPLETLWQWHDMAEEVRDLCRSRESLVAERAEQLRTEVDMFVLRNTQGEPAATDKAKQERTSK